MAWQSNLYSPVIVLGVLLVIICIPLVFSIIKQEFKAKFWVSLIAFLIILLLLIGAVRGIFTVFG